MNTKKKNVMFKVISCIILIICSLAVLYPIIYVVSTAFSPKMTASGSSILPFADGFSTVQFEKLFNETNYALWFQNTLIVAIGTSIMTVICCSLAAYVFSRFKFIFRKGMMMAMLILQIFPSFVGMFAIYVIVSRMKAYDQLWALVLIYVAGNIPYNTWLVKSYLDTIPKSLDEAARIDGANHLKIFFRVILPMARPMIIFLTITSFTGPWMDYIFPKVILGSEENYTLAIGLISFIDGTKIQFTTFAAGAFVICIPFIIFFVLSQKTMTTGLGAGAVKE